MDGRQRANGAGTGPERTGRTDVLVRAYRPSDAAVLADLFRRAVRRVDAAAYTEAQREAWAAGADDMTRWTRSFEGHRCLVAERDGRIVGFGDMTGEGYLDRLYVHPDYRRRGVATLLCDALEEGLPGPFVAHVSIVARPFFEARGYLVRREQQVVRRGVALTNFVMTKER